MLKIKRDNTLLMSRDVRKPVFRICENKDADQLRGNREADQRLCFRYMDSRIPLLPNCEISSLQPSSVAVQPGLCRTWSETPKTGFLRTRLFDRATVTCELHREKTCLRGLRPVQIQSGMQSYKRRWLEA